MSAPNGHAVSPPNRTIYPHEPPQSENPERPPRFTVEGIRDIVSELEVPFDPSVITWRIMNMSKHKLRGQMIPYADQRAYTDRLNQLLTPGGWTRKYKVDTTGNFERSKDQKAVAKIVVTCELTVFGLGTHSATGEEWADDENAATSAEAQAFKRACCCLGLGRYLYHFVGAWVDLDNHRRPKRIPTLPKWATPAGWRQGARPNPGSDSNSHATETGDKAGGSSGAAASELVLLIEKMMRPLGKNLYRGILRSDAKAWDPKSISDLNLARRVYERMRSAERGLERLRLVLQVTDPPALQRILADLNIKSLAHIDTLEKLKQVVVSLEPTHGRQ